MNAPVVQPRHILVVDDEPLVCDAIKMLLAFDGHNVETAHSANEALDLLAAGSYDVIITDFEMPQMKGDEFAARIKSRSPRQPVIMITAYAELLQSSKRQLRAVDVMISKPFLLENLREALVKVDALSKHDGPGE